jgi:hypothetical protein
VDGVLVANDVPVSAIHFSHWPVRFDAFVAPRWRALPGAELLLPLAQEYIAGVKKYTITEEAASGYGFGRMDDGHEISLAMRRGYYLSRDTQLGAIKTPFTSSGSNKLRWPALYRVGESKRLLRAAKDLFNSF